MYPSKRGQALAFASAVVLLLANQAAACTVPVFRYALERWDAAPYRVTFFVKGELSGDQAKLASTIENFSSTGKGQANVEVNVVDVSQPLEKDQQELWDEQKKNAAAEKALVDNAAWAIVRYPEEDDKPGAIWSGTLTPATVSNLLDSPARRETAKRILSGQSAVWVIVESGDKAADAAAAKLLAEDLPKLEKSLVLPEQDPDDPRGMRSELPLKIAFSVITIPANAAAEEQFVRMLVHAEPEALASKGPKVFPIFGRGRALPPLFGESLSTRHVSDYAAFLTGACSCEVKQLNPGTDVLMAADWTAILEGRKIQEPEKLPGAVAIPPGSAASTMPLTLSLPPQSSTTFGGATQASPVHLVAVTPVTEVPPDRTWLLTGAAVSGAVLLASGAYAIARSRRAPRT